MILIQLFSFSSAMITNSAQDISAGCARQSLNDPLLQNFADKSAKSQHHPIKQETQDEASHNVHLLLYTLHPVAKELDHNQSEVFIKRLR
ncbi:hypothetical protein AT238_00685 [Bartonella henselae]|nr:hypothetical protein AT238_00685 [Bartonella henselae]